MLIELILMVFLPSGIFGFGKTVIVGGLFEEDDLTATAFRLSSRVLNDERHGNPELPNQFVEAQIITVNNDPYDVSQSVCALANTGVAAIFGPSNKVTARHVQNMCDTMEIPHIEARWDSRQIRGNGLLNMYPYSYTLSKIYLQLAEDFEWKTFTILYESTENLIRMHDLLKRWDRRGYTVTVRQLPEGPNYRQVLREVKMSGDPNIVLDCSIDILSEVLKQAQQVGLISDKHSFIIASLDLSTINLEPYQHGGTNLTGLRLIDPDDPVVIDTFEKHASEWGVEGPSQLTTEAALIYDSVQVFGRALKQLDDAIVADTKTSLCQNVDSWEHGSSLMNIMRSIESTGMTGLIKFDSSGYRSNFKLDLVRLDLDGLHKIGTWNKTQGISYIPKQPLFDPTAELSLRNKTFLVLIAITPPYGMLKESAREEIGNERFEGFGIDIIHELAKILGFKYIFEVQTDNVYGSKNSQTGEWNGMIKKIMEDKADLAITDLTITADRQEAVDFTMPFMNLGISILFRKPTPMGSSLFSFLMPFSNEVWMYLLGTYLVVSLLFFVAGRLCPAEWNNPYPCIEEPEELENQFSLKNAFWFTIGAIMQQGSEIAPIGMSTRMMAGSWWFFTLIIVSSYTANLAVFLVVESKQTLIKNAGDLLNNSHGIKYGAKVSGSTTDFFKATTDPIYSALNDYMQKNKKEVMPGTNDAGVQKVMHEKYAFFMESSTILYEAERKCNITQINGLLDAKGYGIAMKKNSPYRNSLSTGILKLQETGVLKELENKWWKQKRGGGACEEKSGGTSDAKPLGVANVGGVFLVLAVGVALSCIYTACELLWAVGCTSIKENVSFVDEIKEELKFVVKCSATTKPVRRRKASSHSNQSNGEDSNGASTPPYGFVPTVITTSPEEK
ncbi:glutamate receptor ionotropic, kainate 2-like [Neodiprion lecontei]|uniref:Glutamate receptor ionotropic, kainate 2-like n=1 Tax=Neodiprion lecontei TaxID=441921 RepID=A0ABM3GKW8_NEOLC|nr:glutamate receptor ionotropic, kainate 2-like [Neodiprion lecontei]XP_046600916.1 glutamate receptor ionotropic, kainate 2-like [Neodiprion lecontei]